MNGDATCGHCGNPLEAGQEYCLECGTRVTSVRRPVHWLWPVAAAALVAAGGAAAAIAAGGDPSGRSTIVALSPMRPVSGKSVTTAVNGAKLRQWPRRDGYTVVVAAVPMATGQASAKVRAGAALRAGLPDVGILDSGDYASLHPGYAIVFTGVYDSREEAIAALPRAARHFRSAYAQEITR